MIYVNDKKAVLCKGDFRPAQFYKGDKKIAGYGKETFEGEGTITLENCYNDKLYGAKLTGNCVQEETPSPEAPVEIKSVGDLVAEGEYSGKYKIGVTARGKNLFDSDLWLPYFDKLEDGSYKANRNINTSHKADCFLPEGTYRLSYDMKCPKGKNYSLVLYNLSGDYAYYSWKASNGEWTHRTHIVNLTEDAHFIGWNYSEQTNELFFKNLQIEKGNEETQFEPYKAPQAFELYLEEPLCKIGEYEDYIDFENKKVVRNTSIKSFTGTEGWYRQEYRLYSKCGGRNPLDSNVCHLLNNRFESYTWTKLAGNVLKEEGNRIIGTALQPGSYFCVTPAQVIPTIDEWKTQLSVWNDEGAPFTVVYVDATREEAIDLPTLPTFKGTTNYEITTDINAGISGEYKRME